MMMPHVGIAKIDHRLQAVSPRIPEAEYAHRRVNVLVSFPGAVRAATATRPAIALRGEARIGLRKAFESVDIEITFGWPPRVSTNCRAHIAARSCFGGLTRLDGI